MTTSLHVIWIAVKGELHAFTPRAPLSICGYARRPLVKKRATAECRRCVRAA